MPHHIRIADKLTRQSAEQLVTTAGAVISGLTGKKILDTHRFLYVGCPLPLNLQSPLPAAEA